jgi:hypothetical protein
MIEKKIRILEAFIEQIDKEKPILLIDKFIDRIEEHLKYLTEEQIILGNKFKERLKKDFNEFIKYDDSRTILIFTMLNVLLDHIKILFVEDKANSLGVDRNLYKNEMGFLFKGK